MLDLKPGEAKDRLRAFIARRARQGRGIPALPLTKLANRPDATVRDGVVQHANYRVVGLLAGVVDGTCRRHARMLADAGRKLGYEIGGLNTAISTWPATDAPWRPRFDPVSLFEEIYHLRTAAWIVIAYLSGMRDDEKLRSRPCCCIRDVRVAVRFDTELASRLPSLSVAGVACCLPAQSASADSPMSR